MHGEHNTHVADEFNLPSISQDFDHMMSVILVLPMPVFNVSSVCHLMN